MLIDHNILITYGGVAKKYDKGEIIFHEGNYPNFFFQIIEGDVHLFTSNNEGKELTQGHFSSGQSFGEPPLLINKKYPCTAQTTTPAVIVRITKEKLFCIFDDFPEIFKGLFYNFVERIYHKASMAQIWVCHSPEEKILKFLEKHKSDNHSDSECKIPYTRQQIADILGLRVETVIRALLKMTQKGKVKIIDHKLYY